MTRTLGQDSGGGTGEHTPEIRRRILTGLEGLGLELDEAANGAARPPARITRDGSRVEAWVLPTDEERVLAQEARDWMRDPLRTSGWGPGAASRFPTAARSQREKGSV